MKLNILFVTSRSAAFELEEAGALYHTNRKYRVRLNDAPVKNTDKVIDSVYGLEPAKEYRLVLEAENGERAAAVFRTEEEYVTLNVREFGAAGDGVKNDTASLQAAVLSCPAKGRVLIPAGTYRTGSLFLKSHVRIELERGAVLSGVRERGEFPVLPGRIPAAGLFRQETDENAAGGAECTAAADAGAGENKGAEDKKAGNFGRPESGEYLLGTWEGDPAPMYAGLITGIGVTDVILYGEGIVDGNGRESDWWIDAKKMRGAWRPRMLFLNGCSNITVEGLCFRNSPAWVLHPYFCRQINFLNLLIQNPADSPNTDGMDPESCSDMLIAGIHFSVGDDCVAVKSGKLYMGSNYKTPSKRIIIRNCLMENGHGAVTVGSEMAGGIHELMVRDCLFRNTDRGLRIKTRRGRGKDAVVNGVIFDNIRMEEVMTPLVVNSFYFCDPDGHSEYVQTKEALPVDERTPFIQELYFKNLDCTGCHAAAGFFYGLPEQKIGLLSMENIRIAFSEHARSGMAAMLDGFEETCRMGLFAKNIRKLVLKGVSIEGAEGGKWIFDGIDEVEQEE